MVVNDFSSSPLGGNIEDYLLHYEEQALYHERLARAAKQKKQLLEQMIADNPLGQKQTLGESNPEKTSTDKPTVSTAREQNPHQKSEPRQLELVATNNVEIDDLPRKTRAIQQVIQQHKGKRLTSQVIARSLDLPQSEVKQILLSQVGVLWYKLEDDVYTHDLTILDQTEYPGMLPRASPKKDKTNEQIELLLRDLPPSSQVEKQGGSWLRAIKAAFAQNKSHTPESLCRYLYETKVSQQWSSNIKNNVLGTLRRVLELVGESDWGSQDQPSTA